MGEMMQVVKLSATRGASAKELTCFLALSLSRFNGEQHSTARNSYIPGRPSAYVQMTARLLSVIDMLLFVAVPWCLRASNQSLRNALPC